MGDERGGSGGGGCSPGLLLHLFDTIEGRVVLGKQSLVFAEGGRDGGIRGCGRVWVVSLAV